MTLCPKRRWVEIKDLKQGMRVCEHIRGAFGKILVHEGEVLSQKHVDQLLRWDARPGAGRLSYYTRGVWTVMALGSGEEHPPVEADPYKSIAVQKYYRTNK